MALNPLCGLLALGMMPSAAENLSPMVKQLRTGGARERSQCELEQWEECCGAR